MCEQVNIRLLENNNATRMQQAKYLLSNIGLLNFS